MEEFILSGPVASEEMVNCVASEIYLLNTSLRFVGYRVFCVCVEGGIFSKQILQIL